MRNSEKDYKIAIKKQSKKLQPYPFKKGDIIGNYTVNSDNYVYHHKRYQVELTCECGAIRYKRLSHIITSKNIWCKKCRGYNDYPTNRKKKLGYFKLDIHKSWMTCIKLGLKRGLNRELENSISIEDLREQFDMQNGKCIYTGIILNVLSVCKKDSNASIDRKDSSKGYTKDNIQWVYKPVNLLKNNFKEEEFLYLCKKIANYT